MIDKELFSVAAKNLRRQKLISYLTLLGIVIGIAAVVALISVVQGLNNAVEKQFEMLGTTTITVLPGSSLAQSTLAKLKEDDAEALSNVKGVDYATPIYITSKRIEFKGEKKTALVIGINPTMQERFKDIGMLSLSEGRYLSQNEKYGILIGDRLANDFFSESISLRQKIAVEDFEMRVVGMLSPEGKALGRFFNSAIVMNYETLKEISSEPLTPSRIIVKAIKKDDVNETKQRIEETLRRKHGQKDFMLMSEDQMQESAASVLGVIQAVLIGIAAISLFVGGLGIMNTMFMAITERTKEIGIMKAVGATNVFILSLFLVESSLIGLIGGILGIAFGLVLSFIISFAASSAGLELVPYTGIDLLIGSLLFSVFIGAFSGLIPSFIASKLEPVEALRDA